MLKITSFIGEIPKSTLQKVDTFLRKMRVIQSIQNRIYEIRGERVMLDKDLAALYDTSTKSLNLAVKRNLKRFPKDFMLRLTKEESEDIKFQIAASKKSKSLRFQIETSNPRGGTRYMPYVFTEQGIAMLSGVLNSNKAINMNIAIMRAFIEMRKAALQQNSFKVQLKKIKLRLGEHDEQLNYIYEAMENILDEKSDKKKWEARERVGFKK